MWNGLRFETRAPVARSAPARADVACFVGFAALRPGPVPSAVAAQWERNGWSAFVPADPVASPLPVMLESAHAFAETFDGWIRTPDGLSWEGALSGAVRDFFRQGGRRCWVVSCGPAAPPPADEAGALAALDKLLPGSLHPAEPSSRETWRGIGHLFGLPDVSIVCVPDLPFVLGLPTVADPPLPPEPVPVPQFLECSSPPPEPPTGALRKGPKAPRVGDVEMERWREAAHRGVSFLKRYRPDVELILALPLPASHASHAGDTLRGLLDTQLLRTSLENGLASAWLQLAWPWYAGDITRDRPEGISPADGALAGMLARNALLQGTFRSTAYAKPAGFLRLEPQLDRVALLRPLPAPRNAAGLNLTERLCTFGQTPGGIALLSDVTTTPDPQWRQGGVNRLIGAVRRSVQRIGEQFVFQPNGALTRRSLRYALEQMLQGYQDAGGLNGNGTPFYVRCSADTTTDNDEQNGRMIVEIGIEPVQAIDQITVVLSVGDASSGGLGSAGEVA